MWMAGWPNSNLKSTQLMWKNSLLFHKITVLILLEYQLSCSSWIIFWSIVSLTIQLWLWASLRVIRSLGFFFRRFSMTSWASMETVFQISSVKLMSSRTMLFIWAASEGLSKGDFFVRILQSRIPRLHASILSSNTVSTQSISGAMYIMVPCVSLPATSSLFLLLWHANPKSAILTCFMLPRASRLSRMFPALRSKWMKPRSWIYYIPRATFCIILAAVSSDSAPWAHR